MPSWQISLNWAMKDRGTKPTQTNKDNATKQGKRWQRMRSTGCKTQGISEAITSFSTSGSVGGTAGSAATGLSAGSGPQERWQNRFSHN